MSGSTVAHAHVLVVDNAASVRSLVSSALERAGYHVTTAADGREALAWLQSNPPDVLLADLAQPDLSDGEFREALRARADTLPVLLLRADWSSRAEAAPLTARGGSSEPIDTDAVLHTVARLLGV